jgi:hypothetical protein
MAEGAEKITGFELSAISLLKWKIQQSYKFELDPLNP